MSALWNAIARVLKRRRAVERLVVARGMAGALKDCPHCNPTAKAIRQAQAQWVVAGIDKGE